MSYRIGPVLLGKARAFRDEEKSAIFKESASGPIMVGPLGLAGDEQADLSVHGGVDKAIHHYPHDHYDYWRDRLGGHELLDAAGAFGENISTTGLTESNVSIGDRFRLGSALVEVSQGRQPCWKIDHKFQRKGITAHVITSGRCGWYYRVLEGGAVREGDRLELVERMCPEWTVELSFSLLVAGGYKKDPAAVRELAKLDVLATSWRDRAIKLAG